MMADPTVELWAIDEVMFQLHGSRCRMWIAPENQRPVVFHNPLRKNVGYYGAVRLRDGSFVYQREPFRFNGETCFRFLKHLRKITARSSRRVVIISDNARYHHAVLHKEWREECADRFHLCYLPPYSPELNPIERVWKLTRKMCTHNRYFSELDEIPSAVEPQFDQWRQGNDLLRRLCAIS